MSALPTNPGVCQAAFQPFEMNQKRSHSWLGGLSDKTTQALQTTTLVLASCLGLSGTNALASVDAITAALQAGQSEQARKLLMPLRQTSPQDVQLQFLEGVLLAQQGQLDKAIDAFRRLTVSHPQLLEPHNNLGVLLAAKGKLPEARAAFEKALQTQPNYATTHRNLLDVQTQLAQESYVKALMIDGNGRMPPPQLTLLARVGPQTPASAPTPQLQVASATPPAEKSPRPVVSAAASSPASAAASTPPAERPAVVAASSAVARAPAAAPVQAQASSPSRAEPPAAPSRTPDATDAQEQKLRESLDAWASAWSRQDMPAYLRAYAADFQTPSGMGRSQWESDRRLRITSKKRIRVEISQLKITWRDKEAVVQFRQSYESDNLKAVSRKSMTWALRDGRWRILRETVG
jgi:colicin import membrane protein